MTGFVEVSQNEMMVVDGGDWTDEESGIDPKTLIGLGMLVAGATYAAGYSVGKWLAGLFN